MYKLVAEPNKRINYDKKDRIFSFNQDANKFVYSFVDEQCPEKLNWEHSGKI